MCILSLRGSVAALSRQPVCGPRAQEAEAGPLEQLASQTSQMREVWAQVKGPVLTPKVEGGVSGEGILWLPHTLAGVSTTHIPAGVSATHN